MEKKQEAMPQAKREKYPLPWGDRLLFVIILIIFGIYDGYKTWWSTLVLLGTLFVIYLMVKKDIKQEVQLFGRARVYGKLERST
jgi:phosphatidylglycerophosphate synthase